jgi:hypothetical protein
LFEPVNFDIKRVFPRDAQRDYNKQTIKLEKMAGNGQKVLALMINSEGR